MFDIRNSLPLKSVIAFSTSYYVSSVLTHLVPAPVKPVSAAAHLIGKLAISSYVSKEATTSLVNDVADSIDEIKLLAESIRKDVEAHKLEKE